MRNLLAVLLLSVVAAPLQAAEWPARPIVVVAPGPAGGTSDVFARIVADGLSKELGAKVIVENRSGAGTLIGAHAVARATPDGHTLLMAAAAVTIGPHLYKSPSVDPLRDFTPVRLVARFPNLVVVGAASPLRSVEDLVAAARRSPGALNYSSGGVGISEHLSAELFQSLTATSLTHIPYKGSADAVMAVVSGDAHVSFANMAVALPQVNAGRLRALAVTGAARVPRLPQVPTVAQAGVEGYEVSTWFGLLAPAGTPQAVVTRLDEATKRHISQPAVRERIAGLGAEVADEGPGPFAARLRADYEKWGALIREQHIRAE